MYKALVSVIIPTFNAARYIRQALNSVLAQTYTAFELIVVDDGSSDATSAIVEEFVAGDARIQLVRQSNMGVGAARNIALRTARGKYIAPLDADDVWFPKKLEKQVARMEQCGDETGLVYCWSTLIDEQGRFLGFGYPQAAEGRLRHALLMRNIIENSSVPLFRAAALEQVGVYLSRAEQGGVQGGEDWDLYLRIAETFEIRVVPEYLLGYRRTGSNMSDDTESMAASYAFVLRRARRRNRDLPSSTFRWGSGHFYSYQAKLCYRREQYGCCLRHLRKAVCADPFLLLDTWIYKPLIKASLKAVHGLTVTHFAGQVRPVPNEAGKRAGEQRPQEKSTRRRFFSSRMFERIERKRWLAVLHDGA